MTTRDVDSRGGWLQRRGAEPRQEMHGGLCVNNGGMAVGGRKPTSILREQRSNLRHPYDRAGEGPPRRDRDGAVPGHPAQQAQHRDRQGGGSRVAPPRRCRLSGTAASTTTSTLGPSSGSVWGSTRGPQVHPLRLAVRRAPRRLAPKASGVPPIRQPGTGVDRVQKVSGVPESLPRQHRVALATACRSALSRRRVNPSTRPQVRDVEARENHDPRVMDHVAEAVRALGRGPPDGGVPGRAHEGHASPSTTATGPTNDDGPAAGPTRASSRPSTRCLATRRTVSGTVRGRDLCVMVLAHHSRRENASPATLRRPSVTFRPTMG